MQCPDLVLQANVQRKGRDDHHHTFQTDEQPLVADQRPLVALTQLVDAISASNQDTQDCKRKQAHEDFELSRALRLGISFAAAPVADCVIETKSDEASKSEDLERQAGESNVHANVTRAGARRRQASTGTLQSKRHQVARNENPVVSVWGKAAVLSAEVVDDVGERDIYGGAEKHRRKGDAADLQHEAVEAERVLVHQDAAAVAEQLADAAQDAGDAEPPGVVP